ncbi:MAG: hypothetical protein ACYDCK_04790 [Thermoplasmatota archaeon]
MDAHTLGQEAWGFLVHLAQGVPRGDPLSLAVAAALFLSIARLVMTHWAWFAVKNLTLVALFADYLYLASNVVEARFGHDLALYLRGAGAATAIFFMAVAVKRAIATNRDGSGPLRAPHLSRASLAGHPTPAGAGGTSWLGGGAHGGAFRVVQRDATAASSTQNPFSKVMNVFDPGKEQSLLTGIAFAFIAEFGVFSTLNTTPPTAIVGFSILLAIVVGAALYIARTYHDRARGLGHFAIVVACALAVSLLFGAYWGQIPWSTLLSFEYFKTESMVAATTGIAFSLIIYGRG